MAGAEKSIVDEFFNYAALTTKPPKSAQKK
jgi:hypothetical protein